MNPTDPMNTNPLNVYFVDDWNPSEKGLISNLLDESCKIIESPQEADVILADTSFALSTIREDLPTSAVCIHTTRTEMGGMSEDWIQIPDLHLIPLCIKAMGLIRQHDAAKQRSTVP